MELAFRRIEDNLERYTEANFSGMEMPEGIMRRLRNALKSNTRVQKIGFYDCAMGAAEACYVADILFRNDNLTEIDFSFNQIGDDGVQELIVSLEKHPNLERICLLGNQVSQRGKDMLEKVKNDKLEIQIEEECPCESGGKDVCRQEKREEEHSSGESDKERRKNVVAQKARSERILCRVWLGIQRIKDNIERYPEANFSGAAIHRIRFQPQSSGTAEVCRPGHGETMERLRDALQKNTHVKQINLRSCGLGDESANYVVDILFRNEHITEIDLSSNQIGDEGVQELAEALEKHPNLERISLLKNEVTQRGKEALDNVNNDKLEIQIEDLKDCPCGNSVVETPLGTEAGRGQAGGRGRGGAVKRPRP